jgi:hypothetical protein
MESSSSSVSSGVLIFSGSLGSSGSVSRTTYSFSLPPLVPFPFFSGSFSPFLTLAAGTGSAPLLV